MIRGNNIVDDGRQGHTHTHSHGTRSQHNAQFDSIISDHRTNKRTKPLAESRVLDQKKVRRERCDERRRKYGGGRDAIEGGNDAMKGGRVAMKQGNCDTQNDVDKCIQNNTLAVPPAKT